ncbi:MAG: YwaF family protein [Erysipelotrichaceae bacterium]|nr:YwaF family protein [Erysipelotrichaceae bacterium]
MFSVQHFIWLGICAIMFASAIALYKKKKPSLDRVLDICLIICAWSEITKVLSVLEMVPSANGTIMRPYLPLNHLPLHMCSIDIILIYWARHTSSTQTREKLLAYLYPTCLYGSLLALAMPSIFTTSISVDQAFTHPMAYQFFIYHTMIGSLSAFIVMSKEIEWKKSHYFDAIKYLFFMSFISLYVNSIFASPTYVDGKLVSVDFWPNFFFTYNNPLNIPMTKMSHWYIYMVIIAVLAIVLTWLCFYPLIRKKKEK